MNKPLPFKIDRKSSVSLARQVTDGLRQAIVLGYYQPGERLPTIHEMCSEFGICIRAPQTALKALSAEGLIATRRRIGCVVLARKGKTWKGHVVLLQPDHHPVYYKTVIEMRVTERLIGAGYLVTRLMLPFSDGKHPDFASLEAVLHQSTSLVLMHGDHAAANRFLSHAELPFAVIAERRCELGNCVGNITYDRLGAMDGLSGWCVSNNVRDLMQVGTRADSLLDLSVLNSAGICTRNMTLAEHYADGQGFERIFNTAWTVFNRKPTAKGLPDAYFFADDYIARAAIPALLQCGVRVPGDVRIASWSNVGNRMPYGVPIARMVMNPFSDAEIVSNAVLSYLKDGEFPKNIRLTPKLYH